MRNKRNRKLMSILLTLSMLVTLLVPMVGPASAKSVNSVDKILSVADSYTFPAGTAPVLTLKEDTDFQGDFKAGDTFKLVLPSKVKWATPVVTINSTVAGATYVSQRTDQVLEITMPGTPFGGAILPTTDTIKVELNVTTDGTPAGDVAVKVDPMDSAVTGGDYTFLRIGSGKTTAVAESVETIGTSAGYGGIIRIDETYLQSTGTKEQTVKVKLPSNFVWDTMTATGATPDISFTGGFSNVNTAAVVVAGAANNESTLQITFTSAARGQRGTIYIKPHIKAKSDASYGDVTVSVSGSQAADADLQVAKYADYGVKTSVKEVKELTAGKLDDVKTEKITIEENVAGTFLNGRDLNIAVPSWVKIVGISDNADTTATVTFPTVTGNDSDFDINMGTNTGSTKKVVFKLYLSIEGNKSGDIEATIKGAGVPETKLVVAKALAPVTAKAAADVKDVKIGVQSQEVPDIIITESKKEAAEKTAETKANGSTGEIKLTVPDGVKFAATPKVQVTDGNLELKDEEARLTDSDTVFTVPVKSESIKPGTIKVSGIKLTLDRTVPEGDLLIKVGGSALVENDRKSKGWTYVAGIDPGTNGSDTSIDEGEFDTATVVKVKVGTCVTPAPGEQKNLSTFKIGDTKFKMNGIEKTMDVAPYLKDSRTYMPLRFVAQAAGVADTNIMWNDTDQSVVLIKGDRVVKLTIGSTTLLINGVAFTMDVAPELVDPGRTMLPIRWVAQALGSDVQWDDATQTVTVK